MVCWSSMDESVERWLSSENFHSASLPVFEEKRRYTEPSLVLLIVTLCMFPCLSVTPVGPLSVLHQVSSVEWSDGRWKKEEEKQK